VVIVRGLCDVWRNMNSATFVTDEQNTRSLCPAVGETNSILGFRTIERGKRKHLLDERHGETKRRGYGSSNFILKKTRILVQL
jgi:hypothetical protein